MHAQQLKYIRVYDKFYAHSASYAYLSARYASNVCEPRFTLDEPDWGGDTPQHD